MRPAEVVEFCRYLAPSRQEREARQAAIDRIEDVVTGIWPKARVEVFGSFATGARRAVLPHWVRCTATGARRTALAHWCAVLPRVRGPLHCRTGALCCHRCAARCAGALVRCAATGAQRAALTHWCAVLPQACSVLR